MKKYIVPILISFFAFSCKTTTQTFVIGPLQVPCTGLAVQDCFQIKKDNSETWENLYSDIKGFDYEAGYEYIIKVDVTENKNAPADASSLNYALKEVISKKKVDMGSAILNGKFDVVTFKDENVSDRKMTMHFNDEAGQINGKGVCNRFSGTFTTSNSKIKFSQAATTKMLCREPELERDFFQTMNQVDHFSLKEDELMLMKGNEIVLTASLKTEE